MSRIYLPQDHHRYHHVFVHHHIIRHHTWDVADVNQGGMGYLGSSGSYGVPTYSVPTYSVPASGTSVGVPSYVPSGGYSVGPTNAPSISNSNVNNASIGPGSGIGNQFFG